MKFYRADTKLNFGTFKGKTLKYIAANQTEPHTINGTTYNVVTSAFGYIEWCVANIDDFFIEMDTILELRKIDPIFFTIHTSLEALVLKYEKALKIG